MNKPGMLQEDREGLIRLSRSLTPEERLAASFYHAQFLNQMYQAGVKYRAGTVPSPTKRIAKQR